MKIITFDTQKGIFDFELNDLETDYHAHPAIEIILAQEGHFTLWTNQVEYTNIRFAIIEKNILHKIEAVNGTVRVLMCENFNSSLVYFLKSYQIYLEKGIYVYKKDKELQTFFQAILTFCTECNLRKGFDRRVEQCLDYFEQELLDYHEMMDNLTAQVHLSESHLSRIFKKQIGISLKKYLVWSRLKKAISLFLNQDINLYHAALKSGFYDQAHLSKTFKKIFGVSPSDNYNSRILQNDE